MATYTGTRKNISRRFLLPAASGALAVAAVASAGGWRVTHNGTTKSAATTMVQAQPAQAQQNVVQAAAVPVPLSHPIGGPELDTSLVLVGSDTQAATVQQGIDDANAIRVEMGLAPLNASVVVAAPDAADAAQQAASENGFLAANGVPPVASAAERSASIIADENTLRATLGLPLLTLVDLR